MWLCLFTPSQAPWVMRWLSSTYALAERGAGTRCSFQPAAPCDAPMPHLPVHATQSSSYESSNCCHQRSLLKRRTANANLSCSSRFWASLSYALCDWVRTLASPTTIPLLSALPLCTTSGTGRHRRAVHRLSSTWGHGLFCIPCKVAVVAQRPATHAAKPAGRRMSTVAFTRAAPCPPTRASYFGL